MDPIPWFLSTLDIRAVEYLKKILTMWGQPMYEYTRAHKATRNDKSTVGFFHSLGSQVF